MSDDSGRNSSEFFDKVFPSSERTWEDVRAQQAVFRTTAQLSSAERSKVNDALIAQVGALTKRVSELTRAVDGLLAFDREQDRRIDTLELSAEIDRLAARDAIGMTARAGEQRLDTLNRYVNREVVLLMQRLDAIERGATLLSAWIKRPLWERVRSRLGF